MFDEQWTAVERFLGHRSAICREHADLPARYMRQL